MIKNKIKQRIKANIIDLIFFQFLVAIFLEKNIVLLLAILLAYIITIYKSGYTLGGLFTGIKIYWYGEKSISYFIKRTIFSIFYNYLLFNTSYPLKYNLCGQYNYDIQFKTYVSNEKCLNLNSLNTLEKINEFGYYLKCFMIYFLYNVVIVFIALELYNFTL